MEISSVTGQTATINGIQIYYEVRGEGEPLILLHGGGGIGANWELVFKEPPKGYQLVIPDLRGHGRSTNPSMEFTFRLLAQDVFALIDHLGDERQLLFPMHEHYFSRFFPWRESSCILCQSECCLLRFLLLRGAPRRLI